MNIEFVKEDEYRVNNLDEIPNLQTLIEELRGGRKVWIESTNVFVCLHSSRVWDECDDNNDVYAEASLALLHDVDDNSYCIELCVLSPKNDKGAVASVTARILELPDDVYQSIVTHGDKTSVMDGLIGTSFFTGANMQSFLSKNAKRQYVFENCSFNPQQAAALLKSSTEVDMALSRCFFDEDCHSLSTVSGLLLNDDTARSGELRFHAHGRADPLFLQNLSLVENMLLDKLVLSSFNLSEEEWRRVGQAKVTSLTLEHCNTNKEGELPLIDAIRSGEMYASSLNITTEENMSESWCRESLKAIGSSKCRLQTVSFKGMTWTPNLCNILIDSLRTNEQLTGLAISAKPSDFGDQWQNFLDAIGAHQTLLKVTLLPQADIATKWAAPLNDLFYKSHRVVLFFHSNHTEQKKWALTWNDVCLKLRFRNIPRLIEDGTRSFVLASATAAYSKNTDHLYSLIKANQDFISIRR